MNYNIQYNKNKSSMLSKHTNYLLFQYDSEDDDLPSQKDKNKQKQADRYKPQIIKANFFQDEEINYNNLDPLNSNKTSCRNSDQNFSQTKVREVNQNKHQSQPVIQKITSQQRFNASQTLENKFLGDKTNKKQIKRFSKNIFQVFEYQQQNQIISKPLEELNKNRQKKKQQIKQIKDFQGKSRIQHVNIGISANTILKLYLKRNSSGFNMLWPQYDVYFNDDNEYYLSIKKVSSAPNSKYYYSTSLDNFNKDSQYLGKVSSNISKQTYNIYERINDYSPKNQIQIQIKTTIVMNQQSQQGNDYGPRRFKVYMLKQNVPYSSLSNNLGQKSLNMLYESNKQKIDVFTNKKPIWSKKLQSYVLNFNGRVSKSSIKNFILEDSHKNQILMFGRLGTDIFTAQITYPLTPFIALGIVMVNFDFKG